MSQTYTSRQPEDARERVFARSEAGLSLSSGGFGDVLILTHEAADRALTPNRRELIEVLNTQEIHSIRELARQVERDHGNVHRDLKILAEEDIVGFEEVGQMKRPYIKHDTIIQEPIVAPSVFDE